MTLDLSSQEESKRNTLYSKLETRGWKKVSRPKLTTTFTADGMSDPDVAADSIKAAAADAGVPIHAIDYALLAGDRRNYKEY